MSIIIALAYGAKQARFICDELTGDAIELRCRGCIDGTGRTHIEWRQE